MHLSKTKLNLYSSLSQAKMRLKHGLFVSEGWKNVSDTIASFDIEALVIGEDVEREKVDKFFGKPGYSDAILRDKVFSVSLAEMKKLSALSTPSDVFAVFRMPVDNEDCMSVDRDKLYLILDGVRDPGNLGTIIRTAHWFGIEKIFASQDCVDLYNPKTVMSAMGSLGKVAVVYCNLEELINHNPDFPVYGTFLNGENIYNANLVAKGFIVMGNEGKGVSEKISGLVTDRICIPPFNAGNHSESLNVSIATAVVLALFRKG